MRSKNARGKSVSYARYGVWFCVPFFLAFLLFSLWPVIYTVIVSISDYAGMFTRDFSVLKTDIFRSYRYVLFESKAFTNTFSNTAIMWIFNFIPQLGLALLLTAWFTGVSVKIRAQGLFKVLFYMPNIITAASIAMLFFALFSYPTGPVNSVLVSMGFDKYEFFRDKAFTRGLVSAIQCWIWYGNTTIVLIAGVLGINPALFEAAAVDGADGWQIFRHITLPSLRTIMLYTLVTSMIGGLQMFDIPLLLTPTPGGGPDHATETMAVYLYNQAFTGGRQYNRGAAASMVLFVIAAVLSSVLFYILRDRDAAKIKKELRREAKLAAKGGVVS
ncbi:MAG: sugar ABC transporter permease [Oscillospiraceae bacterium]|nr:sugar ABC transporter permease [Oscillospiraceae bacterium]